MNALLHRRRSLYCVVTADVYASRKRNSGLIYEQTSLSRSVVAREPLTVDENVEISAAAKLVNRITRASGPDVLHQVLVFFDPKPNRNHWFWQALVL